MDSKLEIEVVVLRYQVKMLQRSSRSRVARHRVRRIEVLGGLTYGYELVGARWISENVPFRSIELRFCWPRSPDPPLRLPS
jgi:hypothetical protein